MIRSWLINMIREKAQKGKSAYAIGKELGISKNTAKKYRTNQEQNMGSREEKAIKLDPFKPEIHEMLSRIFNSWSQRGDNKKYIQEQEKHDIALDKLSVKSIRTLQGVR